MGTIFLKKKLMGTIVYTLLHTHIIAYTQFIKKRILLVYYILNF